MLPHRNGFEPLSRHPGGRAATPISADLSWTQIAEKVMGLKSGADDYVTKPFDTLELVAPHRGVNLRRAPLRRPWAIHQFGSIRADIRGTQVMREGKPVYVCRNFNILRYFIEHEGSHFARDRFASVGGLFRWHLHTHVDVHVPGLRQKLEKSPKETCVDRGPCLEIGL